MKFFDCDWNPSHKSSLDPERNIPGNALSPYTGGQEHEGNHNKKFPYLNVRINL